MTSLAAVAFALAAPVLAGEEGRGFAEGRVASFSGVPGKRWQTVERIRPTFELSPDERIKVVGTIEAALTQGRGAPSRLRRADEYLEIDRLYVDRYGERLDVRAGRQALHWGSAQFFNPTDPFPEVLLTEPWRPRRGVNAVRAHLGLGERSDATGVGLLDDALAHGQAAGRARTNLAGTDLAAVGAWRGGHDWLGGLDLRGTLGVGWWVEAALRGNGRARVQAAAGADYSFPVLEKVVVMAQYQRDETTGPLRSARDSALGGLTVQVTPELAVTGFGLASLHGGGGMVIPGASWAATDWLEIAGSGQIAVGTATTSVVTVWTRASF